MKLKPEALNALKLPILVKAGILGSVKLKVRIAHSQVQLLAHVLHNLERFGAGVRIHKKRDLGLIVCASNCYKKVIVSCRVFWSFAMFFVCAEIEFFVLTTGSFFFLSGGELCAGLLESTRSKASHYGI